MTELRETLRERLVSRTRPLVGGWVSSGSPVVAEIMAGSGLDLLIVDLEHAPNDLPGVLAQLQAIAAYPVTAVVRVPVGDPVIIKQVLDLGAQNLIVPMVSTPQEAGVVARAMQYPPAGVRGLASALARSARWNRVAGYPQQAARWVSLFVQIETGEGVANARAIAATPGVDGVLIGPADLAASLGYIGQENHPVVREAVRQVVAEVRAAGKLVGVNAFDLGVAGEYAAAGLDFVVIGADVLLVAQGSDALVARFRGTGESA